MRFFLNFIQVFPPCCRNQKNPYSGFHIMRCTSFNSVLLRQFLLLLSLFCLPGTLVYAAEESKPITGAEAKPKEFEDSENLLKQKRDGVESPAKQKAKPATSAAASAKAAAAQREKDDLEADALADKIAKKMAELHKENELKKAQIPLRRPEPKPVYRAPVPAGMPHGSNLAGDTPSAAHDVHWSYEGEGGPQRWGKIDPANAKCDIGERQSPIDIRGGIRVDLEPVQFDYKPVRFNVIDNGHTIQVNLGAGNFITILGRRYELAQFHFHKPSEERINGRNYDMVAHMVHKDVDGKIVVVAVLIEQGKPNSLIQTVWNNMPLEKNDTVQPSGTLDMNQILPTNRQYFTYMGSLTTPPCTEGVLWVVIKEPIEVSQDQISIFSRMYPMNARPTQNTSGRLIKESN